MAYFQNVAKFLYYKRSDSLGFSFITVAILAVFLFEILVIKPYLIEEKYRFTSFHLCAAIVILFNVYLNLYLLVRTDSSTRGLVLPITNLLPGCFYCLQCESISPPRSYHCKNCDRCILRRDHHCIFSGITII